jgi:hypothetical protein
VTKTQSSRWQQLAALTNVEQESKRRPLSAAGNGRLMTQRDRSRCKTTGCTRTSKSRFPSW